MGWLVLAMNKTAQVLTLITLLGTTGYHTLAPEPQPDPQPPVFADNQQTDPDVPPPVCRTECHWEGSEWVCITICL